ncbi:MAG: STAS domain-containing protein [Candidatus Omnitrophica bacterium]|nr:STAS domain-containing protein [Candidatus Omnitrophota bacterium]
MRDPEPLRSEIDKHLQQGKKKFLIDFEKIIYISSAVLGFLISIYQDLNKQGGEIKLVNVQPSVSNLFELTRLDRFLEMYNDKTIAVNSFRN